MDEVEQDLGPADEDDEIVETEKIVNDLDWNVADWDRTRPLPNLISDLVASTGPLGMEIQVFPILILARDIQA